MEVGLEIKEEGRMREEGERDKTIILIGKKRKSLWRDSTTPLESLRTNHRHMENHANEEAGDNF